MTPKQIDKIATQVMNSDDPIVEGWHLAAASAAEWVEKFKDFTQPTAEAELLLKAVASTRGLPRMSTTDMLRITARISERIDYAILKAAHDQAS